VSREALLDAITRFRQDELSVDELRERVADEARGAEGELGEELRRLEATLEAIVLGICESDRRGAALEQLEPAARLVRQCA
jgi:hypothetical protein